MTWLAIAALALAAFMAGAVVGWELRTL